MKRAGSRFYWLISILFISTKLASAELVVSGMFSNDMILQREVKVPVWGWADPGEKITVSIAGQKAEATTDQNGNWRAELPPLKVQQSGELIVSGSKEIVFKNVAVGDVWFCSGQSNMAMFLIDMGELAVKNANDPDLRLYRVTSNFSATPLKNRPLAWKTCTSDSAYNFSAIGYYFGATLRSEIGVPIGLIAAPIGGSRIEPWMPREVFQNTPQLTSIGDEIRQADADYISAMEQFQSSEAIQKWLLAANHAKQVDQSLPSPVELPMHKLITDKQQPSTLFNGMVSPIMGFPIKGIIWQQGFSNGDEHETYLIKIKALVNYWRSVWGESTPFYYGQYSPCKLITPAFIETLSDIRSVIPNSEIVVTNDVGYDFDLHPKNKDIVGYRFALIALNKTYGRPMTDCAGPIYKSMAVEGNKIRITFDNAASGLAARGNKSLGWFEIAGKDGVYVPGTAEIDGSTVLVWNDNVPAPEKVRMGWDSLGTPNLMNNAGLPAAIFRTHRD